MKVTAINDEIADTFENQLNVLIDNKINFIELRKINNKYFEAAQNEEDYVIPEKRVMYIANQPDGYTKRGYALTKRALSDLMYEN